MAEIDGGCCWSTRNASKNGILQLAVECEVLLNPRSAAVATTGDDLGDTVASGGGSEVNYGGGEEQTMTWQLPQHPPSTAWAWRTLADF